MRNLLTSLIRAVMFLAVCLGIALLAAQLVKLWRQFGQTNPSSERPIVVPADPSVHTEESKHDPDVDHSNDGLDWTREEVRALRDTLGNDAMQKLMEMFRERNGEIVNFNEIITATGRNLAQVRADLSMLSRKSHLIDQHSSWPLHTALPTDGESNRAYSIPQQYIDWWFEG